MLWLLSLPNCKKEPYAAAAGVGCANTSLASFSPGFFFFPKRQEIRKPLPSQLHDRYTVIDKAVFSSNHKLVWLAVFCGRQMDATCTDSCEPICHITLSLERRFATTEIPSSNSDHSVQTKWTLLVFIYPHRPIDRRFCSILGVRSVFKVAINL